MILFRCLIKSRPGWQRQLEIRIQWSSGKIWSWLMLLSGAGNRSSVSACSVHQISRFLSFLFSNRGPSRKLDSVKYTWTSSWTLRLVKVDCESYLFQWMRLTVVRSQQKFQECFSFLPRPWPAAPLPPAKADWTWNSDFRLNDKNFNKIRVLKIIIQYVVNEISIINLWSEGLCIQFSSTNSTGL